MGKKVEKNLQSTNCQGARASKCIICYSIPFFQACVRDLSTTKTCIKAFKPSVSPYMVLKKSGPGEKTNRVYSEKLPEPMLTVSAISDRRRRVPSSGLFDWVHILCLLADCELSTRGTYEARGGRLDPKSPENEIPPLPRPRMAYMATNAPIPTKRDPKIDRRMIDVLSRPWLNPRGISVDCWLAVARWLSHSPWYASLMVSSLHWATDSMHLFEYVLPSDPHTGRQSAVHMRSQDLPLGVHCPDAICTMLESLHAATFRLHAFAYVFPSLPHTGEYSRVQAMTSHLSSSLGHSPPLTFLIVSSRQEAAFRAQSLLYVLPLLPHTGSHSALQTISQFFSAGVFSSSLVHAPSCSTTKALFSLHRAMFNLHLLLYVFPSVPHTGIHDSSQKEGHLGIPISFSLTSSVPSLTVSEAPLMASAMLSIFSFASPTFSFAAPYASTAFLAASMMSPTEARTDAVATTTTAMDVRSFMVNAPLKKTSCSLSTVLYVWLTWLRMGEVRSHTTMWLSKSSPWVFLTIYLRKC
eukprot:comp20662_c0_seq1/m.26814 comp20662_c0_seq1/g.26814  ORF comp20662_c0_seq1/g.26814 comp20662_c0_seq1/m.26814 type:complete len:524 (+) comp20662_c0_seq1:88-1659(+)